MEEDRLLSVWRKAMVAQNAQPEVYQGQFGEFTVTRGDRLGVIAYRALLLIAALCFAGGTALTFMDLSLPTVLTGLYWGFSLGLGGSLLLIHIYLIPLHRTLQLFWLVGALAAIAISLSYAEPLLTAVYQHPLALLGVGFTFAALTGIFIKEAFCFGRFETKLLTPIVPTLLLGHMFDLLPLSVEKGLLGTWAALMLVFALRKTVQAIPSDIGDKSVFAYLKSQKNQEAIATPSS